jgi:hypothetical protein
MFGSGELAAFAARGSPTTCASSAKVSSNIIMYFPWKNETIVETTCERRGKRE